MSLSCQRGPDCWRPLALPAAAARQAGLRAFPRTPPVSPTSNAGDSFARATLELLEVRVFERQALAAHAGEVHGGDDVAAFSLDADEEPLAPARVTELRAHAERQVVVHGGRGRRGNGHRTPGRI